jgi:plasmid stabilization system protein ParE
MNYYELIVSQPVYNDIDTIFESIKNFSNEDDAFDWEDGLNDILEKLKNTPNHQELERETKLGNISIRKILYRQKKVRRDYHVIYSVLEYPKPNPEPNTPYLVGRVSVLFVRHAAQKVLTRKEIRERLQATVKDTERIDELRASLENQQLE